MSAIVPLASMIIGGAFDIHLVTPLSYNSVSLAEAIVILQELSLTKTDNVLQAITLINSTLLPGTVIESISHHLSLKSFRARYPVITDPEILLLEGEIRATTSSPSDSSRLSLSSNSCISEVSEPLFRYLENKEEYCFGLRDLNLISLYQLNPYSGRQISPQALQYLALQPLDLQLQVNHNDLVTTDLSPETINWLLDYLRGGHSRADRKAYLIPPTVRLELKYYKASGIEKIRLYRGINFQEELSPDQSFTYRSLTLSSWSRSQSVADTFTEGEGFPLLLECLVSPKDVLLDFQFIQEARVAEKVKAYGEEEVVLLPGSYECLVLERAKREKGGEEGEEDDEDEEEDEDEGSKYDYQYE